MTEKFTQSTRHVFMAECEFAATLIEELELRGILAEVDTGFVEKYGSIPGAVFVSWLGSKWDSYENECAPYEYIQVETNQAA